MTRKTDSRQTNNQKNKRLKQNKMTQFFSIILTFVPLRIEILVLDRGNATQLLIVKVYTIKRRDVVLEKAFVAFRDLMQARSES